MIDSASSCCKNLALVRVLSSITVMHFDFNVGPGRVSEDMQAGANDTDIMRHGDTQNYSQRDDESRLQS